MNKEYFGHALRSCRYKLGLTQTELAAKIGVSWATVHEFEHGAWSPNNKRSPARNAILAFLVQFSANSAVQANAQILLDAQIRRDSKAVKNFISDEGENITIPEKQDIPANKTFSFVEGKGYSFDKTFSKAKQKYTWDTSFVFIYQGKQGIHHFFKEKTAGFTRTYTDAQLIGKKIQEVAE